MENRGREDVMDFISGALHILEDDEIYLIKD